MWRGGWHRPPTAPTWRDSPCRSPSSCSIVATSRCCGKGLFVWRTNPVPKPGCRAASGGQALVLSKSRVTRGIVLLEPDDFGELHTVEVEAQIALARCPRCGTRPRVLPCDVLPRKRYALAVIGELSATYCGWGQGLRPVVWGLLGERTPSHATLHGWTEGLGAHALGLPGGEAGGAPFSRFAVEMQTRARSTWAEFEATQWVDPRRYCSAGRRERLGAVARVMSLAGAVTGQSAPQSLPECRRLVLRWSGSCVLVFPSRFSCTAIEHVESSRRPPCPIRTRSPPGASSRLRH
jgi:hypothetical protein